MFPKGYIDFIENFNSRDLWFYNRNSMVIKKDLLEPVLDPTGIIVGLKLNFFLLPLILFEKVDENPYKSLKQFVQFLEIEHNDIFITLKTLMFINYYGNPWEKGYLRSEFRFDYHF